MIRKFHLGSQNDALYICSGEPPSPSNDYPRHDADRTCVARVFDEAEARRLVDAANKSLELEAAIARLTAERDAAIAREAKLRGVLSAVRIRPPDGDDIVWLEIDAGGLHASINLGKAGTVDTIEGKRRSLSSTIIIQAAQAFEEQRREAHERSGGEG